jgi:hypothetical protein
VTGLAKAAVVVVAREQALFVVTNVTTSTSLAAVMAKALAVVLSTILKLLLTLALSLSVQNRTDSKSKITSGIHFQFFNQWKASGTDLRKMH